MNKKFGLLGGKLSHSYSPLIHSQLADYSYTLFEKSSDELDGFMKSRDWDGLNVTIPYKLDVLPYLDDLDDTAGRTGSVNTIVRDGKALKGYNTDYAGFVRMVKQSGIEIDGKKCLVLGSGGASHTVRVALRDMSAKEIVIISRSGEDNYTNLYKHADADVIVNTTPVGMYPNNGMSPLELDNFTHLSGVIDLIYNPSKTSLIFDAEERNIRNVSGLFMLVSQAAESCRIFCGIEADDAKLNGIVKCTESKMLNIVLVGMPGCGKTTVGKLIADRTGREFIDTDEFITENYGKSPESIITESGEENFRIIEHDAAEKITKFSGKVISTGGGIVTQECNFRSLRQNGKVIFLERDISSLETEGRPISKKYGNEQLYKMRLPLYEKFSDIKVNAGKSAEETAEEIIKILEL